MRIFQTLLPLVLSIVIARYLDRKKYRVASIAHSILFIFLSFVFVLSTDIPVFVIASTNIFGEEYYSAIHEALVMTISTTKGSLSAFLVIELVIYIFLPIFAAIIVAKQIKEQLMKIKMRKPNYEFGYLNIQNGFNPIEDQRYSQNKTYLVLGRLLN